MRFPLSMVVLMVAVTGLVPAALAQEPLSPIEAQLQKAQSGESYGMKTITVTPGPAAPPVAPRQSLSDNAKALANKAESKTPPSRLETMQSAYKKAVPSTDAENPAAKTSEDKEPEDKEAKKKEDEKKAAQQADQRNEEVMFETMHADDAPKKPARLIPVN